MRGGAEVARWAHNPKVIGSSPIPATKEKPMRKCRLFRWAHIRQGGHRFESIPNSHQSIEFFEDLNFRKNAFRLLFIQSNI